MAADREHDAEEASAHQLDALPHSWVALVAALLVALLAAAAAFYAVRTHLSSRPVDLRDATTALTATLEEVLLASQLPPAAIARNEEKAYRDATAFWTHTEFTVRVPQQLNPAGIAKIVRDEMTSQHVATSEIEDGGAEPALRLSLANRPFATVHFQQSAPSPAAAEAAVDPCHMVIATLREFLTAGGFTTTESANGYTLTTSPDQAPWEIAARLSSALSSAGVTVVWKSQETGIRLVLTKDGSTCTELAIVASSTSAPQNLTVPPQENLPLESALSDEEDATVPEAETPVPGETAPKVAIIVDDGGYGGPVTEAFLALDPRLTLAILPNTPYCQDTADRAAAAGFELMLHMPMESSHDEESAFAGQLETGMTPDAIEAATRSALQSVPNIKGVNNHTGSRFTQDATAMEAFLRPMKEHGLYFVDSRTTPQSVALQTARAMAIPSARRHVFLDNDANGDFIRKQFAELVALARQQGRAVGICHFRASTAAALAELLPTLDEAGIALVHASEIVQ